MVEVVLVAPEIATNTGSIVRLCANAGARLHLVEPLGFDLDDASLRRAGLDYHDLTSVTVHPDPAAAVAGFADRRRFAFSSRASRRFDVVAFAPGDVLVFGSERAGLTAEQLGAFEPVEPLAIPMRPGNRSLNLANAVAIVVYEAWRQHDFTGATGPAATTAETLTTDPFDR